VKIGVSGAKGAGGAKRPSLWVFAGPNGAGKSSLTEKYKVSRRLPIVNPDVIKARRGISEREAGEIALRQRNFYLSETASFSIETTLSGMSEVRLMRRARAAGYKVSFVYVGIASPYLSQMRVEERVREGGHDVPRAAIMRRYQKSMAHFLIAKDYAHRILLLDNSGHNIKSLIWRWEKGAEKYRSPAMPNWAQKLFPV